MWSGVKLKMGPYHASVGLPREGLSILQAGKGFFAMLKILSELKLILVIGNQQVMYSNNKSI